MKEEITVRLIDNKGNVVHERPLSDKIASADILQYLSRFYIYERAGLSGRLVIFREATFLPLSHILPKGG